MKDTQDGDPALAQALRECAARAYTLECALLRLVGAVEYTALGVRGITAVAYAKVALRNARAGATLRGAQGEV